MSDEPTPETSTTPASADTSSDTPSPAGTPGVSAETTEAAATEEMRVAPETPPVAPAPAPTTAPAPPSAADRARRFAFLVIPAVALLELGAHLVQTHSVVSDEEWLAARDEVRSLAKPEDLVVMAPYWTDPIGRELFKDEVLSLAREARPDSTRFPRAVEVSIRGQHLAELADWQVESTKKVGPVKLTIYDNPAYRPLKDDLVNHATPGQMTVSVLAGGGGGTESECTFGRTRVETGGLGFGPALPRERFTCPQGGMLAATVMQPADYRPHRCLFTPSPGPGKTLRVRFENVHFGQTLHGHAGVDWDATGHAGEPPVTVVWKLGERTIGKVVAGNTDGWKGFELDTRDVDGQTAEIIAEVSSPSSRNRLFCFEADTR